MSWYNFYKSSATNEDIFSTASSHKIIKSAAALELNNSNIVKTIQGTLSNMFDVLGNIPVFVRNRSQRNGPQPEKPVFIEALTNIHFRSPKFQIVYELEIEFLIKKDAETFETSGADDNIEVGFDLFVNTGQIQTIHWTKPNFPDKLLDRIDEWAVWTPPNKREQDYVALLSDKRSNTLYYAVQYILQYIDSLETFFDDDNDDDEDDENNINPHDGYSFDENIFNQEEEPELLLTSNKNHDYLTKISQTNQSIQYIPYDATENDFGDLDTNSIGEQAYDLAKNSPVNILSDKELSVVAVDNNQVVGALFTSFMNSQYSFDVVVHPEYQQMGVGGRLTDTALSEFQSIQSDMPDAYMNIDATSPVMQQMLTNRGLEEKDRVNNDRVIMGKNKMAKNWYRHFVKLSQVYGEFWITSDGSAIEADGDVGDYNHEAHVMIYIMSKYDVDYEGNQVDLMSSQGVMSFIDSEWDDVLEYMVSNGKLTQEQANEALENKLNEYMPGETYQDYIYSEFAASDALLMRGASEEEASTALGSGDARSYAMKNWGWKRLANKNIETQTITSSDMNTIARGLYDAYGEEAEKAVFNIYVMGNNKWYNEVPFEVIDSASPGSLREYQFVGWGV